jgi:hypothetical protein
MGVTNVGAALDLNRNLVPRLTAELLLDSTRDAQKQAVVADERWFGFQHNGHGEHLLVANAGRVQELFGVLQARRWKAAS